MTIVDCNISLIPCIKSSRVGHFVMICFVHKTVSLKIFDKREKYGVKILPHEYMACSRSLHWINKLKRTSKTSKNACFVYSKF